MVENETKKYWHKSQPRKLKWNLSETKAEGGEILFLCAQVLFTQVLEGWILGIVKVSTKDNFPLCPGSG